MKKLYILTAILLIALVPTLQAQSKADRIVGYYLTYDDETGQEKSQVQIFKASNGKYYGQIVWLKVPTDNGKPKTDMKNSDKQLQSKPIVGLQILKGFVYNPDKEEWSEGTIYNPANGKTYHCFMRFESGNKLKIRGFIGSAWMGLGKTAYWTKESTQR